MDKREGPITVGFLNDGIRADWSLRPWEGMRQAAQLRGGRAVLIDGDALGRESTTARHKNGLYRLASARNVDALVVWKSVLAHSITEDQFTDFLSQFSQPKVIIEGDVPGCPSVSYDNYNGMAALVRHLVRDHGFTRLGFLGMHAHHIGFQARYRAYCDVLAEEGLEQAPELVRPFLVQGLEHDNGILLEPIRGPWLRQARSRGIQAVVCVADSIALQVMHALEQDATRVPDDMAVVGFDDFRISAMVSPAITTVRPDWEHLGREAFCLAVDLVQGKSVPSTTSLDARVVVRQSCGCRPRALIRAEAPPQPRSRQELVAALQDCAAGAGFLEPAELARGLADRWVEASGEPDQLLAFMEDQLRIQERLLPDLSAWQDLISLLDGYEKLEGATGSSSRTSRARALAASYMDHAREFHRFLQEQTAALQDNLGADLISSFGWPGMGKVLASDLPRVGVPGWDLVLFDNTEAASDRRPHSHYVLGGRNGTELPLPAGGLEFDFEALLPEELPPIPPGTSSVVQSLHFEQSNLGYVIYHTGPGAQPVLEVLTRQISNTVKGTMLVQEAEERSRELRASLETLKTAQAQLIQSEKASVIASLVRGLSHEMNTSLGIIITAVSVQKDLLRNNEANPLATVLTQCGDLIHQSAEKGAQLVERIRSLNPEEGGEQKWFDAATFFESQLKTTLLKQRLMKVDFDYSAPPGLKLFGNPAVYQLVFANLVENTLKHGFRNGLGGRIRLVLSELPEGGLDWDYSDDGVGVSSEVLGHLFEPFGSALDNPKGQGLGTYIIQVLVTQRLGGTIRADCKGGTGLSYRIWLPFPVEGARDAER